MIHVIKDEVKGYIRKQQGDVIKSRSWGVVRKSFPEQATLSLVPEECKLASNREKRVWAKGKSPKMDHFGIKIILR